jgi:hypothetical protein
MGSRLAARMAGISPLTIPTPPRLRVAISKTLSDVAGAGVLGHGNEQRLAQELEEDMSPALARRFSHAGFASALRHRYQRMMFISPMAAESRVGRRKCVKKRKSAPKPALNLRESHPIMYTTG